MSGPAPLRRFLVAALTLVSSTAVALVAGEAVLRAIGGAPEIVSEDALDKDDWFDREIIHLPPAYCSDRYYAVDEARPKLVALGDSFTKGMPVAPSASYPSLLRAVLAARGHPTNVIDLGMTDTGPDQHLRMFERELLTRLTPDVVVWQFYPNDAWDNLVKPTYDIRDGALVPRESWRNWLYRRQQFYRAAPFRDALRSSSYFFRYLLRAAEHWQTYAAPPEFSQNPWMWGFEKIRLAVGRMNALGKERGFRVYYVLVAPQAVYFAPAARSPESDRFGNGYDRMFELLRREPTFIDARFHAFDDRGPAEEIFVDASRDGAGPGGRHFNENGYQLLADLVYARLIADGAVNVARASHP